MRALAGGGVEKYLGPALFAGGEEIVVEAQISMTRGRAEVQNKRNHVPSRPGEPPAVFEGDLRSGIEATQPAPLRVLVTSNDRKSAWLEFGTSRMEARPFMRPARDRKKPEVKAMLDDAFGRFVASTKQGAK
jgi:hypothetical protein